MDINIRDLERTWETSRSINDLMRLWIAKSRAGQTISLEELFLTKSLAKNLFKVNEVLPFLPQHSFTLLNNNIAEIFLRLLYSVSNTLRMEGWMLDQTLEVMGFSRSRVAGVLRILRDSFWSFPENIRGWKISKWGVCPNLLGLNKKSLDRGSFVFVLVRPSWDLHPKIGQYEVLTLAIDYLVDDRAFSNHIRNKFLRFEFERCPECGLPAYIEHLILDTEARVAEGLFNFELTCGDIFPRFSELPHEGGRGHALEDTWGAPKLMLVQNIGLTGNISENLLNNHFNHLPFVAPSIRSFILPTFTANEVKKIKLPPRTIQLPLN